MPAKKGVKKSAAHKKAIASGVKSFNAGGTKKRDGVLSNNKTYRGAKGKAKEHTKTDPKLKSRYSKGKKKGRTPGAGPVTSEAVFKERSRAAAKRQQDRDKPTRPAQRNIHAQSGASVLPAQGGSKAQVRERRRLERAHRQEAGTRGDRHGGFYTPTANYGGGAGATPGTGSKSVSYYDAGTARSGLFDDRKPTPNREDVDRQYQGKTSSKGSAGRLGYNKPKRKRTFRPKGG